MLYATCDARRTLGQDEEGREAVGERGLPPLVDAAGTSVAPPRAAAPREARLTLPLITLLTRSAAGVDAERLQHNLRTSQQGASAAGKGQGGETHSGQFTLRPPFLLRDVMKDVT